MVLKILALILITLFNNQRFKTTSKNESFREDLFHDNVMPIELSSLSSRTEDIPLLIDYFKDKSSK